jgi:hypothetical protein
LTRIDHLAFMAGGVLFPTISAITLQAFFPNEDLRADLLLTLHKLEVSLTRGGVHASSYCAHVSRLAGMALNETELEAQLVAMTEPVEGMVELLFSLGEKYPLSLVADFPQSWLNPILERSGLADCFKSTEIHHLDEYPPGADYEELVEAMITEGRLMPGKSLWIDHHARRTASVIRLGVDAAIFVDAHRLQRDLVLWGLIEQ